MDPEKTLLRRDLIEKIEALPPEKIAEVEDFVDFLGQRARGPRLPERDEERLLVDAAARLSEKSFRTVWDNPEDAVYDSL